MSALSYNTFFYFYLHSFEIFYYIGCRSCIIYKDLLTAAGQLSRLIDSTSNFARSLDVNIDNYITFNQ